MTDTEKVEIVLSGIPRSTLAWALRNDSIHGLGRALTDEAAVSNYSDDPGDDRITYRFMTTRQNGSEASDKLEAFITSHPSTSDATLDAHVLVSALHKVLL